jgi:ABC-type oligopeptide transport system ATPase subunit
MINIRDLTKVYHDKKRGKIVAVDHISFEAKEHRAV